MMIFNLNPLKAAVFQLYVLQLDEYAIFRYLIKLPSVKRGRKQIKPLVWTSKVKSLFILSLFQVLIVSLISSGLNLFIFITFVYIGLELFFIPLTISVALLYPLDYFSKKYLISKAQAKIKRLKDLKIIAIAGSYGKTTFKEILYTILSEKYKVLKTPDSINTPVGISRLIISQLSNDYDVFIVEMGEYYRRDIKKLCDITPPNIAVVTGINEAHFERMKSLNNTIATIFEVVDYSRQNALVVLNMSNKLVRENYKNHTKNKKVIFYGENTKSNIKAKDITFNPEKLKLTFSLYDGRSLIDNFSLSILARYLIDDIVGAVHVANTLNTPMAFIKKGIDNITPIQFRLNPKYDVENDVVFIDDTFNSNPEGVKEAIRILNEFKNRRKIYVTPGMAEAGQKSREIHLKIAKILSKTADLVILIDTSAAKFIKEGLKKNNFPDNKIKIFDHQQDVYDDMSNWSKSGDVILFQNIWPENYV
ncbi:MAG: UDP-N-acetylmuramoyl-tripeptide--D-alanyl-D-alanine ligase [Patescibacteria group bacterium]